MANWVWKGVYPLIFRHSKQLLQNKFFDPSNPSMRKGCDGEKKYGEKIMFILTINIVASQPPKL